MATLRLPKSLESVQPVAQHAYGYWPVSTDMRADSGISLDEQRRKIEPRCTENGWHLEHVLSTSASAAGPHSARVRGAPGCLPQSARATSS